VYAYEFKPASVERSETLHKKGSRVSVEFQNNQLGNKLKVTFKGSAVFDGERLRLERLHRAVKQLRHLRTPPASQLQGWSSCQVSTSEYKFASRCAVPMRFSILVLKFTSRCDLDKLDVVQFNGLV
ncbi:unnamed protein product, partial [Brassica oleracea var. botrytis]